MVWGVCCLFFFCLRRKFSGGAFKWIVFVRGSCEYNFLWDRVPMQIVYVIPRLIYYL